MFKSITYRLYTVLQKFKGMLHIEAFNNTKSYAAHVNPEIKVSHAFWSCALHFLSLYKYNEIGTVLS